MAAFKPYSYQDEVSKVLNTIEKILRENGDCSGIELQLEMGLHQVARINYKIRGKTTLNGGRN